MANYPFIPAHHPMYGHHHGQLEGMPMPLVFPYGMPHQQGHMYGPPGVGKNVGSSPYHGYLVPMQMHLPAHNRDDLYTPDTLDQGMDALSLNPMAEEFAPGPYGKPRDREYEEEMMFAGQNAAPANPRKVRTRNRRSRRSKDRQQALQENVKKTVYISDLDQQITEEHLANFFSECGVVVDCRVCGDPNSAMRFAFVEFQTFEGAVEALKMTGADLGSSRVRVLPSKTAIVPVNKDLMPQNKDEMEQCSRTVYATNIDKKVDRDDVQRFFEALCGPVSRLRLLGDHAHSTRIAFVEFEHADSALSALSCSGALLGTMPIRVSPSKTPVRFTGKDGVSKGNKE